jgi:NAD(P)H-dependent nitrite reductase small subunit
MKTEDFHKFCRIDDVSERDVFVGRLGVRKVAVVQRGEKYYAFKDTCPHAGSPLSKGTVETQTIECPRHHWVFDLESGECLDQPLYCLRLYDVREEDGWLWLKERNPEIW